jgi:plastocyanin
VNQGGETHTFTEVEQFGGGIVPSLNELSHAGPSRRSVGRFEGDDFVAPGGTYREQVSETGTVKFQCCIHPWMKLEAQVAVR